MLLDGLRRLEYRGYDSAGVAVCRGRRCSRVRAVGKVAALAEKMRTRSQDAPVGIAHTRWATHGKPSVKNAHPHTAGRITLVHNGIIENYRAIKERLEAEGRTFTSDTDSEVVAHLIDYCLETTSDFPAAVRMALGQLRGAYALLILSREHSDTLIAVKQSSPLVMGVADDALIFASDAAAIVSHTCRVLYVQDGEMVVAHRTNDGVSYTLQSLSGARRTRAIQTLSWDATQAQKDGYAHFMLKEIMEQPQVITDALRGRTDVSAGDVRLGGLSAVMDRLRSIRRVVIVSCGTSYHAGLIGAYMIEEHAGIVATAEYASEFRYRSPQLDEQTAVIAISQSGETADTLAAVEEARRKGALTLGVVNVVGSAIARAVDAGIYTHAGSEISVASTKAFTSQLVVLSLLTVCLARQRGMSVAQGKRIVRALRALPKHVDAICKRHTDIRRIARSYARYDNMLYIGRKYNYPLALEGALKIKEISYVHAEGYATGEMKHGPIALIDAAFPTVAIAPRDSVYEKSVSGIEEIRARDGAVLAITTPDGRTVQSLANHHLVVPNTEEMLLPILCAVPLQLLAYYVGVARGVDVDTPRNLAKSVTVE